MINVTRTIVCADIHGQLRLLENILKHSKFNKEIDELVVAGDCCDIGNETMQVHKLLADLGAIILVGNHEISHMCGIDITPYDYSLDPDYPKFIALAIACGELRLAHATQGVLITHAGLSRRLVTLGVGQRFATEDTFLRTPFENGELTAQLTAQLLNDRLFSRVHIDEDLMLMNIDPDPMWTDWFYPLWFRPYEWLDNGPKNMVGFFDGFPQIVGHTPVGSFSSKQQRLIAASDVTLVDPYARKHWGDHNYCRYAVIEDGIVSLVIVTKDSKRSE
jgi:hypothetical protein